MHRGYVFLIGMASSFVLFPHNQGEMQEVKPNNFIYWESMTTEQQMEYLDTNNIDGNVLALFEGKLRANDDEVTRRLLDTLISVKSGDNKNIAFYFFLFNRVCINADGAVSEMLGGYCQRMLLNIPEYVIRFLKQNRDVMKVYARILGYELYFKERGTSSMQYDFSDFKRMLYERLNNKPEYDEVLKTFFIEVRSVMDKMN